MRVQQFSPQPLPPPKTLTVAWLNEFGSFGAPLRSAVELPLSYKEDHASSPRSGCMVTEQPKLATSAKAPFPTACSMDNGCTNSLTIPLESASLLEVSYSKDNIEEKERFVVKRANHLSSQMLGCDQQLLDREARFYHELRKVAMSSAFCNTGHSTSKTSLDEPGSNDGFYEVIFREVAVRSHPTASAMIAKLLRKGDVLRGSLLPSLGRETWISLHVDTKEAMALEVDREYFAPVCSARVGLGDLLRRRRGAAGAGREDWRRQGQDPGGLAVPRPPPCAPSISSWSSSDEGTGTGTAASTERWKRLISKKLSGNIRIPRCVVWHWDGDWRNFLLVEESINPGPWQQLHFDECCSDEQAASAVRALGTLHKQFSNSGLLEGAKWLPLLPFHEERSGFIQNSYRVAFRLVRGELKSLLSPVSYELCEKLCDGYSLAAESLSRPPLTLLHGDFRCTSLRFSASAYRPVVTASDWRLVCRGRGAYDFMTLLLSVGPILVRREMEPWLINLYMLSAGFCGEGFLESKAPRAAFEADCRAALLALLAHAIISGAGMLQACSNFEESDTAKHITSIACACDDWDAISLLGGSERETAVEHQHRLSRHSLRLPDQTRKRYRNRLSRAGLTWAERTRSPDQSENRSEAASKTQAVLDDTNPHQDLPKRSSLKKSTSSRTKIKNKVKISKK